MPRTGDQEQAVGWPTERGSRADSLLANSGTDNTLAGPQTLEQM